MKKVLITGANQGIGFETALQLAQLGYFVYLGYRNQERGLEAVKKLKDIGLENVEGILIDIADGNSIRKARVELESKTIFLDILINNAGIAGDEPHISTCNIDNLKKIFDTNVFGTLQTIQEFLPLLKKSLNPSIINVSSEVGSLTLLADPEENSSRSNFHVYGSSKTAINAVTLMLSSELRKEGISVNSITPGFTATELNNFQGRKRRNKALIQL
ncbi:SDR family NAD(P)-dependent oxidoreductase [Flavobacterium sp.]|uniref:SDR family NAD(P)-dependent oxidoreductase n=1 Tax=Flavobacterium sp. TaxID=239 RepID=UPI00374D4519